MRAAKPGAILAVNTGSASVRLALYQASGQSLDRVATAQHPLDAGTPAALLDGFVSAHPAGTIALAAHRVVHGGPRFSAPQRIDAQVESEIGRLSALAPLHHPVALAWVRACREVLGEALEQVAVFDTAFHAGLPAVAATYALPRALAERHGLRRYGFHGIAHRALWSRWRALRPDLPDGGRLVTLQLGAGCSACAIERGRSVDTSMGYSPLEGLMMGTRCGDVDPGLLIALQREAGLTPTELARLLNTASGLLGVSGLSADMRVLLASDEPQARLAVALFCHRARKALGAYLAVLHGADGVVFGGGIGENAAPVRSRILAGFEWAGLLPDEAANTGCAGREARITFPDSRVEAWVVPVDEGHELATQALALHDTT